MYKIHKVYEDYNNNSREEDFYFNLNESELIDMEVSEAGGLEKRIENLSKSSDMKEAVKFFKEFVLASYGIKTDDGRFVKNQDIRDRFTQSAAYNEIFLELAVDVDKANMFIKNVLPKDDKIQAIIDKANLSKNRTLPNKHN